jgi:hypothetical protein
VHPDCCYLSPTQFGEKFGLAAPVRVAQGVAPADTAAAGLDGRIEDAETDTSDEDAPASIEPAAAWASCRRRFIGAALIVLVLGFALWVAALALQVWAPD